MSADKAEIFISWVEVHHCVASFQYCYWPRIRKSTQPNDYLRVSYGMRLEAQLKKWLDTPKFYNKPNHGNEYLVDVKIELEWAIVLYEVAEAANQPRHLGRLMGNIQTHLSVNFKIELHPTKTAPSTESDDDCYYDYYEFIEDESGANGNKNRMIATKPVLKISEKF